MFGIFLGQQSSVFVVSGFARRLLGFHVGNEGLLALVPAFALGFDLFVPGVLNLAQSGPVFERNIGIFSKQFLCNPARGSHGAAFKNAVKISLGRRTLLVLIVLLKCDVQSFDFAKRCRVFVFPRGFKLVLEFRAFPIIAAVKIGLNLLNAFVFLFIFRLLFRRQDFALVQFGKARVEFAKLGCALGFGLLKFLALLFMGCPKLCRSSFPVQGRRSWRGFALRHDDWRGRCRFRGWFGCVRLRGRRFGGWFGFWWRLRLETVQLSLKCRAAGQWHWR